MRLINSVRGLVLRKDWTALDSVLTGYTVFVPLINLLWSVEYWLTLPEDKVLAPLGTTLFIPSGAFIIATILFAGVWFGTKKGYWWGFATHAAMGTWLISAKNSFGLFSTSVIIKGEIIIQNPYGADHGLLRDSFVAVSLYCLIRVMCRLLLHGAEPKNLRGGLARPN